MEDHELIDPERKHGVRSPLIVAELNFEDPRRQQLNHRADLAAYEAACGEILQQCLLGRLATDLRERSAEVPALSNALRAAYDNARRAERTALPFETWRDDYLTQTAVA